MNAILQAVASAKSAKKPDTRTLGEKWGDDRWGPPGVRREQPKPPEPEWTDWDIYCCVSGRPTTT